MHGTYSVVKSSKFCSVLPFCYGKPGMVYSNLYHPFLFPQSFRSFVLTSIVTIHISGINILHVLLLFLLHHHQTLQFQFFFQIITLSMIGAILKYQEPILLTHHTHCNGGTNISKTSFTLDF